MWTSRGSSAVSDQVCARKTRNTARTAPTTTAPVARDIRRLFDLGFFDEIKAAAALEAGEVRRNLHRRGKARHRRNQDHRQQKNEDAPHPWRALAARKAIRSYPRPTTVSATPVLELYEGKGFANTTVDMTVEEIGRSRVRVVYNIQEGRQGPHRQHQGSSATTNSRARELKKTIKTKPAFWFLGGKYEEEKFEADLKSIVDEYGNHGRLEGRHPQDRPRFPGKRKSAWTLPSLSRKVRNTRSARSTSPAMRSMTTTEILDIAKVHAGDVHNKGQVAKDAEQAEKGYQDSGYIDAAVMPLVTLDKENKTTNVIHNVEEGELKYIKEIEIAGNEITQDDVVRREMLIEPGDPLRRQRG